MLIESSIGEVIDKLTILDIKCERIQDSRVEDCKKERDILLQSLQDKWDDVLQFYRKMLKYINIQIWDDQEICRVEKDDIKYGILAKKIIQDNDARFRVKRKINEYCTSSLREQKSYTKQSCILLTHLGLGDQINMIGAVRYFSCYYDEVLLPVVDHSLKKIQSFYEDDPNIKCISVPNNEGGKMITKMKQDYKSKPNFTIIETGCYKEDSKPSAIYTKHVPMGFYDDCGLSFSIFRDFFFLKDQSNHSLTSEIQSKGYKVVIVHKDASNQSIKELENLTKSLLTQENVLVIDLMKNPYPANHPKFRFVQPFVFAPVQQYISLFKIASEVYMIDSSIYCISIHYISENATQKECYVRKANAMSMNAMSVLDPTWKYIKC